MDFTETSGFTGLMGSRVTEATAERVRMVQTISTDHLQPAGLVHGGVYAALAESAASIGASINVAERGIGIAAVGLENHTTFLRAVGLGSEIRVEAIPRHAGRQVQAWTVTMRDAAGRELALATVRLHVVHAGDRIGPAAV